jgi:hypothetical protein
LPAVSGKGDFAGIPADRTHRVGQDWACHPPHVPRRVFHSSRVPWPPKTNVWQTVTSPALRLREPAPGGKATNGQSAPRSPPLCRSGSRQHPLPRADAAPPKQQQSLRTVTSPARGLRIRVMEMIAEAQWWFFWMGAVFGSFICFSFMLLPSRTQQAPTVPASGERLDGRKKQMFGSQQQTRSG